MPRAPPKYKAPGSGTAMTYGHDGLQKGNLTHQQRLAIVRKKDEEPRWTQEDLARWAKKQFGLLRQPTQSTISNILKARERLETMTTSLDAKSVRPVKHPELDAALLLWLRDRQSHGQPTTGDAVRDKARHMAQVFQYVDEMTYSNGWMRSFLTRHGVEFRRNQVDPREAVIIDPIRDLIARYPKQDVFTFVTTNLWYRLEPKKESAGRRLLAAVEAGLAGAVPPEEPSLVVGLGVNMDGSERWSPVYVSRAKQPPSFQQKSAFQWNFLEYYYNGRAQMTSTVFEVWLKRLNQRMAQSHRRVLLVLDSAPSHLRLQLSHVAVVVHADSELFSMRPLGTAVAGAFKACYRKRQLESAVDRAEAGETDRYAVSQLKAMRWVEQAWLDVPHELLADAWAQVDLLSAAANSDADSGEALVALAQTRKSEIHDTLTHLLEQLDVPGRIKSHDVVAPRGEDDRPHYVYDDATIVPLVAGALATGTPSGGDWDADIVDVSELELPADATGVASQMHRALLAKLEQFRGVIQTIDEDTPPSDELATVLAFLRRRQATMRAELQRLARESAAGHQYQQQQHHHHHTKPAAAATRSSGVAAAAAAPGAGSADDLVL